MFTWKKAWRRALVGNLLGCLGVLGVASNLYGEDALTIGSTAPKLDIEHWVQNGNGKFTPVTNFAKGKVYVVEFWATWCGPCIGSMPHLVEIQKKFADKQVQIVSISNEDLETVEEFLKREYTAAPSATTEESEKSAASEEGDAPKTYGDLTSAYCLTTDPDRSSDESYMRAAGQNGIPCAFIVGKDQKIEWIGHPMNMDAVLQKVVDDQWDREAFATEFKETQKMDLLMAKIFKLAGSGKVDKAIKFVKEQLESSDSPVVTQRLQMIHISLLAQSGKTTEAMEVVEELLAASKEPAEKRQYRMLQMQLLLSDVSNPKLEKEVTAFYEEMKDDSQLINMVAWEMYGKFNDGSLKNEALLKASRIAAENAAEKADAGSKAAILDTAAHLQFLDGDIQSALKTETQAVALATDALKPQLTKFLEELEDAAK